MTCWLLSFTGKTAGELKGFYWKMSLTSRVKSSALSEWAINMLTKTDDVRPLFDTFSMQALQQRPTISSQFRLAFNIIDLIERFFFFFSKTVAFSRCKGINGHRQMLWNKSMS